MLYNKLRDKFLVVRASRIAISTANLSVWFTNVHSGLMCLCQQASEQKAGYRTISCALTNLVDARIRYSGAFKVSCSVFVAPFEDVARSRLLRIGWMS